MGAWVVIFRRRLLLLTARGVEEEEEDDGKVDELDEGGEYVLLGGGDGTELDGVEFGVRVGVGVGVGFADEELLGGGVDRATKLD